MPVDARAWTTRRWRPSPRSPQPRRARSRAGRDRRDRGRGRARRRHRRDRDPRQRRARRRPTRHAGAGALRDPTGAASPPTRMTIDAGGRTLHRGRQHRRREQRSRHARQVHDARAHLERGGVEMRLNIYFASDGHDWWANEIRTYNGKSPGDWIEYTGTFFRTPLGTRVHRQRRPRRRPTARVTCTSRICGCSRSCRPPRARTRRRSTRSTRRTTSVDIPNGRGRLRARHDDAARHRVVHRGGRPARVLVRLDDRRPGGRAASRRTPTSHDTFARLAASAPIRRTQIDLTREGPRHDDVARHRPRRSTGKVVATADIPVTVG